MESRISLLLRRVSAEPAAEWRRLSASLSPWRAAEMMGRRAGPGPERSTWEELGVLTAGSAMDSPAGPDACRYLSEFCVRTGRLDALVESMKTVHAGGDVVAGYLLAGLLINSDPAEAERWDSALKDRSRFFWRGRDRTWGPMEMIVRPVAEQQIQEAAATGNALALERRGDIAWSRWRLDDAESSYREAAEQGRPTAMYSLSTSLDRYDQAEANRWLYRAATGGYTFAMATLAERLARRGQTRQARHWLARAEGLGYDHTAPIREYIDRQTIAARILHRFQYRAAPGYHD